MLHRAVVWLRWWAVLTVLYLLLVDTTVVPEVVSALLSAAVAATVVTVALALAPLRFAPRPGWFILLLRRLPPKVLADCALVFGALWRTLVLREPVRGAFYTVPFDGGGDDARAAARRALVIAGVSLPPNSVVVAIDAQAGHLLVHQLVSTGQPPGGGDREWPL